VDVGYVLTGMGRTDVVVGFRLIEMSKTAWSNVDIVPTERSRGIPLFILHPTMEATSKL
jgi:hypothetical protein